MPAWKPKGLTPAIFNRIKERVQKELGGIPTEDVKSPGDPGQQGQMSSGLWKKILDRAKDFVKGDEGKIAPGEDPNKKKPVSEKLDLPTIRGRIGQAGRLGVLLLMKYNGVWRHVEPYSFRIKTSESKKGAAPRKTEFFYGYCRLHDEIHSFRMEKIEGLYITDEKFTPRWVVEVG